MNGNKRRNAHQVQGCLGRMVNLLDFGTVGSRKKLLTDKPYFDDGLIKSKQFDQTEDKVVKNGTPMKMLLAEEMSKEMVGSTNLVAKLMGLDSFPQTQPDPIVRRSNNSKPRLKRSLSHGECREDVYEIWEKQPVEGLSNKKKMDIVRDKFLEAKRLVTDDKLRHSKEFQEAMEVMSSNKELFLEFLQESNSSFSRSTAPPTPEKSSKRITILKPSKSIESEGLHLFKWSGEDEYNPPTTKKTTRIVVLKPNGHVAKSSSSCPTSPRGCLPVDDFEEIKDVVARRVKRQILKEEDTSHSSSVFSNGYVGDDSYYADSEIISSPVSRRSWEYMEENCSPFSPSSSPFSRASESPESSSVCREAKKRLSERWALMASSNEKAEVIQKKGTNISLGEMLALSDSVTDLRSDEEEANDCNEEYDVRVYPSSREEGNLKPFNSCLMRSKSLPESSTSFGHRAIDTTTNKSKSKVPEELTKSKSLKWFLKVKVSNLLFSRNKKASKERSSEETPECDASVSARSMVSQEAGLSVARSTTFGNSSEWRDEPSPVSVLQTSFDEEDGMFFSSSVLNRSSSSSLEPEMMRSNLLGKSPSIGRSFSFDDSTVSRCYSSKRSTVSTRDEEEDLRLLINTLLSAAGLDEESESISSSSLLDNLLSKWHSVESPLDPSLRESYANSAEHQRLGSNMKQLVFDLVNTLLLELTPSYLGPRNAKILSGKTLGAYLVNRMQECLKGKGRVEDRWWDEDGDLSSLAVNRVVRMEVAEIGSPESLRLEMDCMGEELELKLLEELMEGVLMDFSEQS